MFDLPSFIRITLIAVIYAGIEYRYVNRREAKWTKEVEGFYEKPALWNYTPYHLFFLLPLFVVSSYAGSLSAWAGNVFLSTLVEDIAYFGWRGRWVSKGEWTTKLFGSTGLGRLVVPVWWLADAVLIAVLYGLVTF